MATKKEKTLEQMTDRQLANAFKEICRQIVNVKIEEDEELGELKAMHDLYELSEKGVAYSKEMDKRAAKGSKAFKDVKAFMDSLTVPAPEKEPAEKEPDVAGAIASLSGAFGIPPEDLMKFVSDCISPKECKKGHCTCKKKARKVPKEVQDIFDDIGVDMDDIAGYAVLDLDSGQFFSEDFSKPKK